VTAPHVDHGCCRRKEINPANWTICVQCFPPTFMVSLGLDGDTSVTYITMIVVDAKPLTKTADIAAIAVIDVFVGCIIVKLTVRT